MSARNKISPAFDPFLSESGSSDKRDAIVVYRAPEIKGERVRRNPRRLKGRHEYVSQSAAIQARVATTLFTSYKKASRDYVRKEMQLNYFPIGANTLPVSTVEVTQRTLPALAEQPDVVAVLPNQKIHLIQPKDVDYSSPGGQEIRDKLTWGLKQLDIPKLWKTTKGKWINVAVLDTGVHAKHPALKGRVKEFVVIDPLGRRIEATPMFDSGQHGTHVCGTIAGDKTTEGVSIGVAPEANLLVAGVLVGETTLRTLLEGISWAVEKGADIINMSLGFSYYEPLFNEVLKIIIDQYGILPIVAIGNENHGNSSSPGNVFNAFSVGAVEKISRNKVDVAFFSGGASLSFPRKTPDIVIKPDVVAPGVQVYSSIPPVNLPDGTYEYTYMHGTSMATPHVSGVAALLMSSNSKASISDIIQVLKNTAWHPNGPNARPDNRWGYGLIQPFDALMALSTKTSTSSASPGKPLDTPSSSPSTSGSSTTTSKKPLASPGSSTESNGNS